MVRACQNTTMNAENTSLWLARGTASFSHGYLFFFYFILF
jgi:hypothetical protein